jgi:hypothetical protein
MIAYASHFRLGTCDDPQCQAIHLEGLNRNGDVICRVNIACSGVDRVIDSLLFHREELKEKPSYVPPPPKNLS